MTTRSRHLRSLVAMAALAVVGACTGSADAEVAGVTITTSTTIPGPVAIDDFTELGLSMDGTYVAESFLVPLTVSPDRGGWVSRGAGRQWASLWFDVDQDGTVDATLTLMAHRPETDPETLITDILRVEGVRQLTPTVERTIGDSKMLVVDVEGDPVPQSGGLSDCSRPASAMFTTIAGYELFEDGSSFGIPACHRSRLWVVPVDGNTITIVGVAEEEDHFEDLMTALERLLTVGVDFGVTVTP